VAIEPLLTVDELAALLRVSKASVWRWHREEGLPAVRPAGDLRFRSEDVATWIEGRKVASA
jgi:excisionase family DNA binding protein